MNDSLNDFLNRMGISENAATPTVEEIEVVEENTETAITAPTVSEPEQISEGEFSHLLNEIGFSAPPEAEAEEIIEEESDHPNVTMADYENSIYNEQAVQSVATAMRDLDAEEDADWQEAVDSGGITPVEFNTNRVDMPDSPTPAIIDAPAEADYIWQAETAATEDNGEVHFHMPDGSVMDVPIVEEHTEAATQEDSLPLNSPTLLVDASTSRFSGAEWYNEIQRKRIIFAGCGGVGSWCALMIARMKPLSLVLYDDDVVEEANMSGQLYSRSNEGQRKVTALRRLITQYTSADCVYANSERYTDLSGAGDVMMCGFDNMEARKTFFHSWKTHVFGKPMEERKNCLFLDGRLSIGVLQVFCITGDDEENIRRYREEYLFDDSEADETICSLKQTSYMACMIGSFMTNLFVNWCANLVGPIIPYDLPFFTEYDAQNMLFRVVR